MSNGTRRPIVAGNWKMHTTVAEARDLARTILEALHAAPGTDDARSGALLAAVDTVLCPPFVSLTSVHQVIAETGLSLGAQNMNASPRGALTGEVSWTMLQGLCAYVIIGHSERRTHYHESDRDVNAKVLAALEAGLTPIACVGEHEAQRDAGETDRFVTAQVRALLASVGAADAARMVIAYEPLWAIGTGRPATPDSAQQVAALIRGVLADLYDADVAQAVRVVYGGSVTGANGDAFAAQRDVDGALVGGASLKASDFAAIVRAFAPET